MAQYLPLPNGKYFEIREGETPEQALSAAMAQYPEAFGRGKQATGPRQQTGLMADFAGAGANLMNIGRTGIAALTGDTTKAAEEGVARQEALQQKYKSGFDPEKIVQKFDQGEYFGAAGEAISQVPSAIASLLPSVGQEFGLAAAGRLGGGALGTLVAGPAGTAVGQQVGQYALPFIVNAVQALGSQAQEKVQTQKEAGEKPDVNALELAPYAAGNAALNLVGTKVAMPSAFKKALGQKVAEETADEAAAAARKALITDARKVAGRGTFETILRGTGGFALGELPTEILQDVVDRAAVGKSLTDDDAFQSYRATALNMVLASPLGGGLGVHQRMGARSTVAAEDKRLEAQAAIEAEAAKNQPDALRQLDDDFRTAQGQLAALNAQVNAAKPPKKGATEEQKAAYDALKAQRAEFINTTFKPLKQEFVKRKGAIGQMYDAQQASMEAEAAAGQQAAKLPLPSDIPGAQPFQLSDTARLMNDHETMQGQIAALEQQLAAGPDVDTQSQLMEQRNQLLARVGEMAPVIEERGGVATTEAEFTKALAAAEKERLRLLEIGDFDAAAQQAAKVKDLQNRAPFLQELRDFRQMSGQTRDLFGEMPAQPEGGEQSLKYVTPSGKPIAPISASAKDAAPLEVAAPKEIETLTAAQTKIDAAQTALDAAVKTKDTTKIFSAVDTLNQAQNEKSRAQGDIGRSMFKPAVLDIFSPANVLRTAIENGDTTTINRLTAHADNVALNAALDQNASEREKLINVLENRAGLGGSDKATETGEPLKSVKRERANLFEKQYEPKQQALFKNGTYPDKKLQELYDKGGPAAVEYENVMRAVEELSKKVTTRQGNAKKSLYEQLVDLAAQHEALKAQLESGIATPTMREKTAALQAKMGKGEAPAPRQMDAKERHDLNRRIEGVVNKYKLVEGQITPIRDEILKLHDSLYVTTPLEKVSKEADRKATEAEEKKERSKPLAEIAEKFGMESPEYKAALEEQVAKSNAAGRVPKVAVSREAKTASRINAGDVRKEAETSQKMRDLAYELGQREPAYQQFEKDMLGQFEALKKRYGPDDRAVINFRAMMGPQRLNKAIELGKKTPEYKATLKEQIEYFKETLASVNAVAGPQKAASKRTGQVTRKQSGAPRVLRVAGSAMTDKEIEQDIAEGTASEKPRNLRGVETDSVELDSTTVSLLKQNDIRNALTRVGNDSRVDDFSRTIAKLLKTFLDKTDVKLVAKLSDGEGNEVLGAATSQLIELNTDGGLSVETLLHEGTHAAAERIVQLGEKNPDALTREQKLALNELKAIHARIKNDPGITSKNAKGSLSEFIAEVMSNRNLQKQLAQRKWKLSNMWVGIKSVIMRMLGVQNVETMFGASAVAIEQLFVPSSVRDLGGKAAPETRVTRNLSAKDVAALHDGSNSMKQFADQFGNLIKQKDRTPEDVERIATGIINEMIDSVAPYRRYGGKSLEEHNAKSVVAIPTANTLDYKSAATMSDGKLYDPNNPLHFVEAEPATFAALKAMEDPALREREADAIAGQRRNDFLSLAHYFVDNYQNYTTAETALVLKAAAKYGVISDRSGKLKLVEIGKDNRHSIAVVGKEGADAVIEQLRAGKNLKQAFLDGLQKNADENAKSNERKSGWKKFDQSDNEQSAIDLNAGCAGTPWCTGASVSTARSQIEGGDFYVYYNNGRPEVAVRMNGKDQIGEVRGNNPNQALDKNQQQLAESFLRSKGFSNADKYVDEFARKERLVKLAKGEGEISLEDLLNTDDSFINDRGEPGSSYSLERALSFRTIDGYGNRPEPTQAVKDFFIKKYLDAAVKAYENNEFVFSEISLRPGREPSPFVFAGKTYTPTNDTIKAAKRLNVNALSASGEQEVVVPNLVRVGRINMFRGVGTFPALQSVPEITFFRGGKFGESVVNLPADAKVGTVAGYNAAAHGVINGPKVVGSVVLRTGDKGLFVQLPDTQFVAVNENSADVADKFGYEATNPMEDRLEKDGFTFSALRRFYRGDATAEEAATLRGIIKQPLSEFFTALREDFGAAAYDKMMENTDIRRAYDSLDYEHAMRQAIDQLLKNEGYTPEAFAKMSNLIKYTTGVEVSYPEAALIAPNRRGDTPASTEYEEAPEERLFAPKNVGVKGDEKTGFSFRSRKQPSEYGVGRPAGVVDTMLGNMMGLAGRVQYIDQYAALEAAAKKGLSEGVISSAEATNANYLLRFGQQRSQFAGQFLTNGPVQAVHTKKDGGVETVYRSTKGTSMIDVAQKLNEAKIGNDTEREDMFTLYMAGERANQVGWEKLNYENPSEAKAKYDKMMAKLNANATAKKAFKDAADLYQTYNAGLLDFLVQTGALSAKKAAELKAIRYVPFYRINSNGEVQLMIDKERPVRIANIKDQPQLKELVGGNTEIMPIFASAAQNTFMITGMGLRNQAVKETSFMLQKLGIASAVRSGKGPAGNNVVRFQRNGEDYYALIDTDAYGIPAELIVRGMEGIKTTMPAVIKAMGIPANILRSFVVRNPTYALRQVIRDPLNAWLTTGTDATPVLSSMKELASMVAGRSEAERKLMETGAISSNVYSGDERDMAKFLKDLSAGKPFWDKALAKLDAFAMQGDAATRAVIYKDSLAKGMSEQEALLRTLESMNFSRRGVSPSMQALSVLIPFFNAQVQGLDVLYRAFKGNMPYSEQLEIRSKLFRRGLLLAAGTIAYAAMMEDDEAYKRAKPQERYGNWFVYVPGVKEPVRVPIPFELGYLFKALPEAVWNTAFQDTKASYAAKGMGSLIMQTIPLSLPQAVKPVTEAVLGKSFYSGDIESTREKDILATERYRDSSTELAKAVGAVTGKVGLSPITIDYLIRGYTGGLGVALVQLANPILAPDTKEIAKPSTKASNVPFIGGLFQPTEGRGTLDEAYDRMQEVKQIKGAFNDMVEKGQRAEAKAFAQSYADEMAAVSMSGSVQKRLGELAKVERQIKAHPTMTTEQKDAKLAQIDKAKVTMARQFLAVSDRTTPR